METGRGTMRCGWALFGLLLSSMVSRISALSVTVLKEECVYEYVFYGGDAVSGNFVVVDHEHFWNSDHPGIDFTVLPLPFLYVTSPEGNIVHTLKGTSGDKFEFKAPKNGLYKFCFHNNHESTPETVSFNIHTGHIPNEHDLAKDEHLDPINVRIIELREKMEYVTLEQNYLKARDISHRRTNQSTKKRVIFYTVGEYLLLVLVSGLQVVYVRRLFNKSIAYNRV
ncbi:transmembrane emp24 domain-containing protein p24beta3 [Phtheirospermum japonicum]|uniref:Transmembrane emp24 domain-containing protein p24beta3 n=1 Tax=Phtheirospermum japonicum TaxID=374723 RepID=A0A830BNJ8_9LAMI|nr:transmembrane emp24 domain-containing protein p24beta3 [Phtheirospermum japonicum]